jgi:hypothetical protein
VRLNGKRAIMEYLGRHAGSWRAWQAMKLRYGRVIWLLEKQSQQPRYWTLADWLNQVDMDAGQTVYDAEYDSLVQRVTTQRRAYENAAKRLHGRRHAEE